MCQQVNSHKNSKRTSKLLLDLKTHTNGIRRKNCSTPKTPHSFIGIYVTFFFVLLLLYSTFLLLFFFVVGGFCCANANIIVKDCANINDKNVPNKTHHIIFFFVVVVTYPCGIIIKKFKYGRWLVQQIQKNMCGNK